MKILIAACITLAIIASLCGACVEAKASSPVALVANCRGDVQVTLQGTEKPRGLNVMTELAVGDRLTVGAGAEVRIVFYSDTHSELVKGPCQVKISVTSCLVEKGGAACVKALPPYKGIKTIHSIKSSSEKFGGVTVRGADDIVHLVRPYGVIASSTPEFEWEPVKDAQEYLVEIEDNTGEKVLGLTCRGTTAPFPGECPPLSPGSTFFWSVKVKVADRVVAKGSSAFRTLSAKSGEKLKALREETAAQMKESPRDASPHVVLFTFYLENGLMEEAFQTCLALTELLPGDRNIHYWMGSLYEMKGMDGKAKEEYEKAGVQVP